MMDEGLELNLMALVRGGPHQNTALFRTASQKEKLRYIQTVANNFIITHLASLAKKN